MKGILVAAIVLFTTALTAQSIDTSFTWTNFTGTEAIKLNVESGTEDISIVFEGTVSQGSIDVDLMDPDGERQGGFQLNSSSNDFVTIRTSGIGTSSTSTIKDSNETVVSIRSGGNSVEINEGAFSLTTEDGTGINISSSGGVNIVEGHTAGSNDGEAKGVMVENISDPAKGTWTVKVRGENASGDIRLVLDKD